ncbi:MFS general substrate transporter [Moniliophthora roreri MCA 2997]|uniref:MFS general substrate transporter n=1 Tax=Moniliophthora roreri (strain MCA 2997) TaxID=1381753 RepID=V2XDL9_MONRO|nr:MFS general substrate transporter [Moniliophthora roreri MCA 2997]
MSTNESKNSSPPGTIAHEKILPSPDPSHAEPAQPLDGGVRAWSTVAGSWFLLFGTLGYLYSYGVYQDYYTRFYLLSSNTSSISWMGSVQLALPYLLGIPMGKLFDAGYIHSVLAAGSTLFVFSLFMVSLAKPNHYYQLFLSQGIGMGLGVGCVQLHSTTIVSRHFLRRRAFAYGIALTGASVGSLVYPIMLNRLIYSIGFGPAVRASAGLVAGCVLLGNILVKSPAIQPSRNQSSPAYRTWLKDPAYMLFTTGTFVAFFGFYFPIVYLQLYAMEKRINTTLAFYSLSILNGSSIFGRLIANYTADHLGLWNIQIPCTFLTAILIWLVLAIKNPASLVVVAALYGLISGAWLSLCMVGTAAIAKHPSEVGVRTGGTMGLVGVAVLFSAPLQGGVLGPDNSWVRSVAVSASFMLVGAVLTLGAGYCLRTGRRGPSS